MPIKVYPEDLMRVAIYRFEKNTPYLIARIRVKDDAEALRVVEEWKRRHPEWKEVCAHEIIENHPLNHTTRAITEDGNQYTN